MATWNDHPPDPHPRRLPAEPPCGCWNYTHLGHCMHLLAPHPGRHVRTRSLPWT